MVEGEEGQPKRSQSHQVHLLLEKKQTYLKCGLCGLSNMSAGINHALRDMVEASLLKEGMVLCDSHRDETVKRWNAKEKKYKCERCAIKEDDDVLLEKDYFQKYVEQAKERIEKITEEGS